MTKLEIIEEIRKQVQDGVDDFESVHPEEVEIKNVKIDYHDTVGGEGEGENYLVVLKVTPKSKRSFFVAITGYYDSWNGTDFTDGEVFETQRRKKTIEVWGKVK